MSFEKRRRDKRGKEKRVSDALGERKETRRETHMFLEPFENVVDFSTSHAFLVLHLLEGDLAVEVADDSEETNEERKERDELRATGREREGKEVRGRFGRTSGILGSQLQGDRDRWR